MGEQPKGGAEKGLDWRKLLEEVRQMRLRVYNAEIARLDESRRVELDRATKDAGHQSKTGSSERQRLALEVRRVVDDDYGRTKAMLDAKYSRLEQEIAKLADHFQNCSLIPESENRRAAEIEFLKDKLTKREAEDAEIKKQLAKKEVELAKIAQEKEAKEKDLAEREADLVKRIELLSEEMSELAKRREELNKDYDQLGARRNEVDKDVEKIEEERKKVAQERARLTEDTVQAMTTAFQAFARKLLNPGS